VITWHLLFAVMVIDSPAAIYELSAKQLPHKRPNYVRNWGKLGSCFIVSYCVLSCFIVFYCVIPVLYALVGDHLWLGLSAKVGEATHRALILTL
jgi:hypothetical protein